MSLKAAASVLVIFLLSLPVVKGEVDWGVTYSSRQICALKGSTVDIPCTYTYPSTINNKTNVVQDRFWFTKMSSSTPVDLKTDSDYSNRVEYHFNENDCTLRIKDLRERDSVKYKFRFTTNQQGGRFTGEPGVTLTVTDLQVQVKRSSDQAELKCHSSCTVAKSPSYVWYRNGQKMAAETSSLRVRVPNSNSYTCAVKGHEDHRSAAVYAPKTSSVSQSPTGEVMEGSPVTLTCSSDANPAAAYTWYKESYGQLPTKEAQLYFRSIQSSDSGQYYCGAENDLGRERTSGYTYINVKYAPKSCSMSVSPNGEIIEGSPVTLTCRSDGYPAPQYTWYKECGRGHHSKGSELVFSQIQSSDSGRYYCSAKNDLGMKRTSGSSDINVKYAPKLPSVSVSPTAEKVEGSSVTLTCSSDANPAANYTWYKKTGNWRGQQLSKNTQLVFRSIQSSDSGEYYCEAENKLGSRTSEPFSIDVKYAPKLPSVSVSPSAEVVEGSSVIMTCSSDANPAANYTWYKENEDSPKSVGLVFIITDLRAEHSGNYSCEAQNSRGRHNSTLHLIVVTGNLKFKINIMRMALMLLMMTPLPLLTLWMRKKKTLSSTIKPNEPVEMIEVYANVSAILSAQTEDEEEQ